MNIGYFASFTVFLALNDADFRNAYLRSSPQPQGLLPLSTYLRAWGWMYAVVSLVVALAKREVNYPPGVHAYFDLLGPASQPWGPGTGHGIKMQCAAVGCFAVCLEMALMML